MEIKEIIDCLRSLSPDERELRFNKVEEKRKKEKEEFEKRKSFRELKKGLTSFSISPYPPTPDAIKNLKIRDRYLYDAWICEKSPNSGTLIFEVSFESLEEMNDFIYYFLERGYKVREQDFGKYEYPSYKHFSIRRNRNYFFEDLICCGGQVYVKIEVLRKKFDNFWEDLLSFSKENDFIFPMTTDPLVRGFGENTSIDWWITQNIIK